MSEENEGGATGNESEPTAQFDAFRARQEDDREQQGEQTQTGYGFPAEYNAEPTASFPPVAGNEAYEQPFAVGGGYGEAPTGPIQSVMGGGGNRKRSIAIMAGAVVLACGVGFGIYAAVGSSGSSSNTASASATPSASSTAGKHGKDNLTFRVVVVAVGAQSFTGTMIADGKSVTVEFSVKTHFGTKAHPFSKDQLEPGEHVEVRGRRTATGTVDAGYVAQLVDASAPAATAVAP